MKHITCEIDFEEARGMWCVTVYVDDHWDSEHWFHSILAANEFAARRKLWGSP